MSEVKTDKISSVSTNGDITLDPDGTGDTIVASGNLGVGTTSPARDLHVSGGTDTRIRTEESGGSMIDLTVTNSGHFIDSTSTGDLTVNKIGSANMIFKTANAESSRIDASGQFMCNFGQTTDVDGKINASSGNTTFGVQKTDGLRIAHNGSSYWNRFGDGVIIYFRSAGNTEGQISVSGSTVSYSGGHLSRWSQLADNTKDTSIVKGTVMTNLDQMAEWTKDGVTEDNEQLNCMAVSSVEGDPNVAGVFVNWDEDDEDYDNDMNVGMTGDMVIRIASGTTVARGDLLMSAGDGTAKPQGNDIVRSKTIAKVTSTTVSHTYDDGTYLVPCVLMAC